MKWQPISTAPKNGSIIWLANAWSMRLGYWRRGTQHEHHGTIDGGWGDYARLEGRGPQDLHFAPTHWQHTPELPNDAN